MRTPTPAVTLDALRVFSRPLLRNNLCQRRPAICIYLSPESQAGKTPAQVRTTRLRIAKAYAWETVAPASLLNFERWKRELRRCTLLPSDSYLCFGGESNGSGRSIFVDDMQLKGVGRTVHAGVHSFFKDASGAYPLTESLQEMLVGRVLSQVLTVPPIPIDFILALRRQGDQHLFKTEADAKGSIGSILGRRGTPLRHAHIDYLLGSTNSQSEDSAMWTWRRFVNRSIGRSAGDVDVGLLEEWIRLVIDNSIALLADARLYGLNLTNWRDNSDLFSRVFDLGEIRSSFPRVPREAAPAPKLRGENPFSYFARWPDYSPNADYHRPLCALIQALGTLEQIADRIGLSRRTLHRVVTWRDIHHTYEFALKRSTARLLGLEPQALDHTGQLSRIWPLWLGRSSTYPFNWEEARSAFFAGRSRSAFETMGEVVRRRLSATRLALAKERSAHFSRLLSLLRDGTAFSQVQGIMRRDVEPAIRAGRKPDVDQLERTIASAVEAP